MDKDHTFEHQISTDGGKTWGSAPAKQTKNPGEWGSTIANPGGDHFLRGVTKDAKGNIVTEGKAAPIIQSKCGEYDDAIPSIPNR